jgi:4-phospho-D-threonate 3-dehydrogenase / 4-phospho-D-erythronate 3-dehydrogenase
MSNTPQDKPIIGFTVGDVNGIGPETLIKTLADNRLLEYCTPVIIGSSKVINFYRKGLTDLNFNFTQLQNLQRPNPKQVNILNCWEDEVQITPGQVNETGGKYAAIALQAAVEALKKGELHGLVTAPIHKKNIQSSSFNFTGHTPFLQHAFGVQDVLMLMCADNMRVGLVTEHVPVKEVAQKLSKDLIVRKLKLMHDALRKDFGIDKPKIAVLGLNPHNGDEGLVGKEEEEIIKPAIKDAKAQNILAIGPYSADAFFARSSYTAFDGVLAMYHDQGLIPFKSLAYGEGVNYTAGLPVVRTSPDHGTAFDIAGKGIAEHSATLGALYQCIDILALRHNFAAIRSNPLKRKSNRMLANAKDEALTEE